MYFQFESFWPIYVRTSSRSSSSDPRRSSDSSKSRRIAAKGGGVARGSNKRTEEQGQKDADVLAGSQGRKRSWKNIITIDIWMIERHYFEDIVTQVIVNIVVRHALVIQQKHEQ